jgi:putative hydrolase of the HAD superfamily
MRVHGKLLPKPSKRLLRKVLVAEKMSAKHCVLIEDSEVALKAAKALGMRTVLVSGYTRRDRRLGHASPVKTSAGRKNRPVFVDVKVKSVRKLPLHRAKIG